MSDDVLECEKSVGSLMEEYYEFLHVHSGLGNILAGGVILIICLVNWLMESDILAAVLSIGLSIYWVYGTNVLRCNYYSALGGVTSPEDLPVRTCKHGSVTSFVLMVCDWLEPKMFRYWRIPVAACFGLVAFCLLMLNFVEGNLGQLTAWLTIGIMGALPFVILRYLISPMEVLSSCILTWLCVSAIQGELSGYVSVNLQSFLYIGFFLIFLGALEDWSFHCLKKRFAEV